jgi:hypothetical protein
MVKKFKDFINERILVGDEVILKKGTILFHGTAESIVGNLTPSMYDDVLWTAKSSKIAQSYLPKDFNLDVVEVKNLIKPQRKGTLGLLIQKDLGINFGEVEWINNFIPKSWDVPKMFGNKSEEKRIEMLSKLIEKKYKVKVVDGECQLRWNHKEILPIDSKLYGKLYVLTTKEDLRLYDISLGESDLTDVQYHDIPTFRKAEELGYDGMIIDDFAQMKGGGNVEHTSYGFFKSALSKFDYEVIEDVLHPEYEYNTGIHSDEYLSWLNKKAAK